MAGTDRPARLNRSLLLVVGLVLLLAGAFGLAFGTGLLTATLPALDPTVPLLPEQLQVPGWTPWAATASAVVLGLLCLRWLLAQLQRRPKTGTWVLPTAGAEGTTTVDTDHLAAAVAGDIETYEHVTRARAALVGDRRRPTVHLDVTAGTGVDLTALRSRITAHALPRLRTSVDAEGARADMVVRLTSAGDDRARVS